ncbi:MAG: gluconate 2-dehydrogenase subunit 3 family protein [Acidobacteria bacterium]|nr:gluconate 2-dehydrogenase subunit 3 family protein [Acidobacteriota bacterium]
MDRRDLLQLAAAAPGVALAQVSTAPDWKPEVFDAHQNETIVILTELIIPATDTPGAKAALVNRWMDRLLAAGPAAERDSLLEGLAWLDGYAAKKHGKPFKRLTEAQQVDMLTELDRVKLPFTEPGQRFFRQIKGWTARVYYATDIGMRELNKGGRVPSTYGCTHASHA